MQPSKLRCSICSRGRPVRPIEQLLGIDAQDIELRTSAVYSSGGSAKFLVQAALFNLNGMGTAKLKVSGNAERDR